MCPSFFVACREQFAYRRVGVYSFTCRDPFNTTNIVNSFHTTKHLFNYFQIKNANFSMLWE